MTSEINKNAHYTTVNGLHIYYEVHGSGRPLIVLPGGYMTVEAMGAIIPALAETRQVIGVELQGHGHTADIDRPLSYELMADDIAALIKHLGYKQVDVLGYSLGGGVALQTASRHPEVVRRLVIVSAAYQRTGWFPEVLEGMASMSVDAMSGIPMHDEYLRISPQPERWPLFVTKMRELLGTDSDWTEEVAAFKMPTLIVFGDADSISPAHIVKMFELLGGGKKDGGWGEIPHSPQLAILPGTTHFTVINRTDLLLPIVMPFLDKPIPGSE